MHCQTCTMDATAAMDDVDGHRGLSNTARSSGPPTTPTASWTTWPSTLLSIGHDDAASLPTAPTGPAPVKNRTLLSDDLPPLALPGRDAPGGAGA